MSSPALSAGASYGLNLWKSVHAATDTRTSYVHQSCFLWRTVSWESSLNPGTDTLSSLLRRFLHLQSVFKAQRWQFPSCCASCVDLVTCHLDLLLRTWSSLFIFPSPSLTLSSGVTPFLLQYLSPLFCKLSHIQSRLF